MNWSITGVNEGVRFVAPEGMTHYKASGSSIEFYATKTEGLPEVPGRIVHVIRNNGAYELIPDEFPNW